MNTLLPQAKNPLSRNLPSILILSSNNERASWLTNQLQGVGGKFDVRQKPVAGTATQFCNHWRLVIVDANGPTDEGLCVCQTLRHQLPTTPILFLARSTDTDEGLRGLEQGADDYICHPVNPVELVARTRALLRRHGTLDTPTVETWSVIRHKNFSLDKDSRELIINNETIPLTNREFELIWFLANHPNKVFSRSELLDKVWGYNHNGYEHTVNSHINRLRKKLNAATAKPKFLETVWGIGYRFRAA